MNWAKEIDQAARVLSGASASKPSKRHVDRLAEELESAASHLAKAAKLLRQDKPSKTHTEEVLSLLVKRGPLTARDISDKLGLGDSKRVFGYLRRLCERDLVERIEGDPITFDAKNKS